MNLDKAKKRIAKKIKMGFQGYPTMALEYFGKNQSLASEVAITLVMEEGAPAHGEKFTSATDIRENEVLQSAIVKMLERTGAKTLTVKDEITLIS